jgi:lipid-A-disaccharide synthase
MPPSASAPRKSGRRDAAIDTFHAMHMSLRQNASARIAEALDPYLEGA